ncbi:MAG: nickel-dependent hydrogenase large subunit, partial [Deltaproteobacteria bacterium]
MGDERTFRVDLMTRVEGEGRFVLRVRDGEVVDAELSIFEAPRFFEALLRGRSLFEVPDLTARICGICPVAYQISSARALEAALGLVPTPEIERLRRLLYCGEWIESHALHVFMLHAPDFLGYESAIEMARDHR